MNYVRLLRQMMYKRLSPSVTFRHGDIISFPGISRDLVTTTAYTMLADCNVVGRFDATEQSDDPSESARGRISLRQEDISQIRDMVADANAIRRTGTHVYSNHTPYDPDTDDTESPLDDIRVSVQIANPRSARFEIGVDDDFVPLPDDDTTFHFAPPRTDEISEAVAKGEIKSTGNSVSVDDVIARIDAELEDKNDDDHP